MALQMDQFIGGVGNKVKNGSSGLALIVFKTISGVMLGLTFALMGQEIVGYGSFAFMFWIVLITGCVLRMSRGWGFVGIILFNLFCVLVGMILKMYVLIAPGA